MNSKPLTLDVAGGAITVTPVFARTVLSVVVVLSALEMSAAGVASADSVYSASSVLTLEDCKQMASEGNINVKNTHLDYMSAKMVKSEAFTHYFPVINLQAAGFCAVNPLVRVGVNDILGSSDLANNLKYYIENIAQLGGINTTYEALNNAYGAALTLSQPIFAGGRIINGNRLASLGVQAATLNESIAKRDVVTDIEKKYWLAVSLEEKMKLVEEGLQFAESLYRDAVSAFSSGLVTESDVEKVEMGRQDLKAKRIRLKGSIILARMDLCNAIGLDCSEARTLVLADRLDAGTAPDAYYRDPSGVVASMEEAQLLELAVQQKKLEKNIAMGEALPEVGLGASYSYGRLIGTPQSNGALLATVKIPITDWAKTSSKMKNLDYQMEKAANQREYLCSMLELQLRQFWVEVESTWEELQLKEENVAYARDQMDRTGADVKAGLATVSQLMEKQVALSNAECERIDARITYSNAVAAFQARCGDSGQ